MKVQAHYIHEKTGMLARRAITHVPRVGDEIRFHGERYFKVTLVVWVMDEDECPYERVNIGVVDAATL